MQVRSIPLSFIASRHKLSWSEVNLGLREGWLTEADVINHAVSLTQNDDSDEAVKQIASLGPGNYQRLAELVLAVAERERADTKKTRLTWMRLILAWVLENRHQYDDPFGLVEGIYADFDYPDEIRDLIRYNEPSDGYRSQDHSKEENLERLYTRWEEYVKRHSTNEQ